MQLHLLFLASLWQSEPALARPQPAVVTQTERAEWWTLVQPLRSLAFDLGAAPSSEGLRWHTPDALAALAPYAVIEGAHSVHVAVPPATDGALERGRLMGGQLAVRFSGELARGPLRGRLYLPDDGGRRLVAHPFTLDPTTAVAGDSEAYRAARQAHAAWCAAHGLVGAAWWRSQAGPDGAGGRPERQRHELDAERTYGLLSGGRALAENLRLSDLVEAGALAAPNVALADVRGIETPELDWSTFARCAEEGLDPLARAIPADQHAVFMPSFAAFVALVDELRVNGTPVLDLLEPRGEDARVEARYERQLALELDAAARLLGSGVVRTIALTGGDPYLRTGSDLALVFECEAPELLERFVAACIKARAESARVPIQVVELAGAELRGAADPARDLSSWLVRCGDVVIVSNSRSLAQKLVQTLQGALPALVGLDEYRHFRARYPRGAADEAAFLVVPDGAIRRWCGPGWRITSARRVRVGAVLAEAAARDLAARSGLPAAERAPLPLPVPDLGVLVTEPAGPRSERYGTARFMTPIAELVPTHVTSAEVAGYEQWRRGYERLWSNVFDPIAARVTIRDRALGLDLSVLPIALRSEYRAWLDVVGRAELAPHAGGGHPEALAYAAVALDRDAPTVRELEGFMRFLGEGLDRPLAWLGDHATLWFDRDDAFLAAASAASDLDELLEEQQFELPVGVALAVRDPLRLSAFLAALKGLVDSAAPGVLQFTTRTHDTSDGLARPYVALEPVAGTGWEQTPSLYYAIVPGRLIASLREDVVQRALERFAAPPAGSAPWNGVSVAARFHEGFKDLLSIGLVERELRERQRRSAFMALPILNELRVLAPEADPVEVLAEVFGATVRCPGGGEWAWDEAHGTYASAVFGCPAAPRDSSALPAALELLRSAALGVDFERLPGDGGLFGVRSRVDLERR